MESAHALVSESDGLARDCKDAGGKMRLDLVIVSIGLLYGIVCFIRKEANYHRNIKPHIGFNGVGILDNGGVSPDPEIGCEIHSGYLG